MNKLKKGDKVKVMSGKDKGKTGTIEKVLPKIQKIVVSEINIIKKHMKPTQNSKGGIIEQTAPLFWSKVKKVSE